VTLSPTETMLKIVEKDLDKADIFARSCLTNAIESRDMRWQKFQITCIQRAYPNNSHVQERTRKINAILAFSSTDANA